MARVVSAAEANRQFSRILGEASRGEDVVITRRGEPVARLAPIGRDPLDPVRDAAFSRLLATLEQGVDLGGERFDRDSLYD